VSVKPAAPPRFEGFADSAATFFEELLLHNDREWFERHREVFQTGWQRPMEALLAELEVRLRPTYPAGALGRPKVFRLHRDVRFSKDKSPYKTNLGGILPLAGSGEARSQVELPAALYVHVSHDELFAGAGLYGMDPATLARHRRALLDERHGRELDRILAALRRAGMTLGARESLKRPLAGTAPDHPRAELLRMKGLIAVAPLDRRLLTKRALVDRLVEVARACAPLNRWLLRSCR
jgi:uncharacterized protein (TIGR02453 family)